MTICALCGHPIEDHVELPLDVEPPLFGCEAIGCLCIVDRVLRVSAR